MKNRSFTFLSPALYCAMSLFASTLVHANNLPPVAVIDLTPDKAVYYHGEIIALYGGNSYVQSSGNINYYQWYINGILKMAGPGATSYNHTVVMQPGLAQQQLTIRLRVLHSNGQWDSKTITRTEKQKPGQHYYLTDHLGSVRATVNEAGTLIGWDDFYPFGMVMPGRSSNSANPNDLYKFTGHERDREAGLEIDFMNARTYDSEIGRFLQRDPLAYKMPSWNPYHYTFNNPLRYTDPDGKKPEPPYSMEQFHAVQRAYRNEAWADVKATVNLFKVKAVEVYGNISRLGFKIGESGVSVTSVELTPNKSVAKVSLNLDDGDISTTAGLEIADYGASVSLEESGKISAAYISIPVSKAGTIASVGVDKDGDASVSISQKIGRFISIGIRAIVNPVENRAESNQIIQQAREETDRTFNN